MISDNLFSGKTFWQPIVRYSLARFPYHTTHHWLLDWTCFLWADCSAPNISIWSFWLESQGTPCCFKRLHSNKIPKLSSVRNRLWITSPFVTGPTLVNITLLLYLVSKFGNGKIEQPAVGLTFFSWFANSFLWLCWSLFFVSKVPFQTKTLWNLYPCWWSGALQNPQSLVVIVVLVTGTSQLLLEVLFFVFLFFESFFPFRLVLILWYGPVLGVAKTTAAKSNFNFLSLNARYRVGLTVGCLSLRWGVLVHNPTFQIPFLIFF